MNNFCPRYREGVRFECSSIGSDESGTGGFFGPCTFASFNVTMKNLSELKKFSWFSEIKDSTQLPDEKNIQILNDIKKSKYFSQGKDYCIWNIEIETYNAMFSRIYNECKDPKGSHEKIKCIAHNFVHRKLHYPDSFHVLDNFLEKEIKKYYDCKKPEVIIPIDIFFQKGENITLSTALASILARGSYLKNMQQYSDDFFNQKITEDDNHSRIPSKKLFEPIFEKLENQGHSRDDIYWHFCKIDRLKQYDKNFFKKIIREKSKHKNKIYPS